MSLVEFSGKQALSLRFLCRKFTGSAVRTTHVKGYRGRLGQREKVGHEAVPTDASATHTRRTGENMAMWSSAELGETWDLWVPALASR